jgi:site-specific DNA-methyltransferase (adenine-specific)
MRELCHAALPLQKGTILDPFMGAGSTVAAADALGYNSVGIEIDETFYEMAQEAVPGLSEIETEVEEREDFDARGRSHSLKDFS